MSINPDYTETWITAGICIAAFIATTAVVAVLVHNEWVSPRCWSLPTAALLFCFLLPLMQSMDAVNEETAQEVSQVYGYKMLTNGKYLDPTNAVADCSVREVRAGDSVLICDGKEPERLAG